MQVVALTLTLLVGGVVWAALIAARHRPTIDTARGMADAPHRSPPVVRWFAVMVIGAAGVLEVGGLVVSLRAYRSEAPPAVDMLVMAGVGLLSAGSAYFFYLWTRRQFAVRAGRRPGPPLE